MKSRRWFSLRGMVFLLIAGLPLGWLAREYHWLRARHQFGRQHAVTYVSGTSSRPLLSNSAYAVTLAYGSPASEIKRARQLFPEARYVGQFVSESASKYRDFRFSFEETEITWFGDAPDRERDQRKRRPATH